MSVPGAGSAAADASTRVRADGDELLISGMKRGCTGAGHAEQSRVYARIGDGPGGRGLGAVLVDGGAHG